MRCGPTLHDIVAVGDKAERDGQGEDGELPDGHGGLGRGGVAGAPGGVDDGPGADGVADVVSAMGERGSASGQDLHEGVGVLDLVRVLLGVRVDALHAGALGSARGASLGGVDVVVQSVEGSADDVGGDTLEDDLHVVEFVDLAGAEGVVAEGAQGPGERALALHELLVQALLGELVELLVRQGLAGDLALDLVEGLLVLDHLLADGDVGLGARVLNEGLVIVLDHGVVGDDSLLIVLRGGAAEEQGALDEHPPLDGSITLDDAGVNERYEEQSGQKADASTSTHGDGGDVPGGLLAKTKVG